jgi:hypothetical protein
MVIANAILRLSSLHARSRTLCLDAPGKRLLLKVYGTESDAINTFAKIEPMCRVAHQFSSVLWRGQLASPALS